MIAGALFGASASAAYAASATSNTITFGPINGYSYYNSASVTTFSPKVRATTNISNVSSVNVPSGYMGVSARLYNDINQLISYTDFVYNSVSAVGIGYSTSDYTVSGTYYSQGYTKAYNGNGYDIQSTYQSPNLNN